MRSIFLRIYIGIVCAVLVIGAGALSAWRYWDNGRLDNFLLSSTAGTLSLIADGSARHSGQRQEQWLALSQRVTSLQIELIGPAADTPTRQGQDAREPQLVQLDDERRRLRVPVPGHPERWLQLILIEADVNEQLVRGTQLLLLNELGRHPQPARKAILDKLQQRFNWPLQWLSRAQLSANYLQRRALERGDTVVEFQTLANGPRIIRSIAPIGNSGDYLQQGPIPLFEHFPRSLLMPAGLLSLALLALTCFLLVRPLERRLGRMAHEVDGLQLSGNSQPVTVDGNDALTALANKINAMSGRIYQLLKAQRDLNHAVSHELKTPLARLQFRRELALQKLQQLNIKGTDTRGVQQHLDGMETSLRELNSLVEEILLYARLDSAAPSLTLAPIPLAAMLDELFQPIQTQHCHLQLSHTIDPQLKIYADAHYLHRALQNLLGNAQRYAQSQIQVQLQLEDNYAQLLVDDDGPGIDPALWQQIMEPFQREESSRNRNSGGSGLGLAIVRQIARWHHGELKISQAELGGVRATLTLSTQKAGSSTHPELTATDSEPSVKQSEPSVKSSEPEITC